MFNFGNKADTAPLEEIDEAIAILKALQKHQREITLLVQRTQTMCPALMDFEHHNPFRECIGKMNTRFQNVSAYGYLTTDEAIKTYLEQLMARKKEMEQEV